MLCLMDRVSGPDMRRPYLPEKTLKNDTGNQLESSSVITQRMEEHIDSVGAEELYILSSCQGSICERQGGCPVKVPNGTRPKFS